eukprot:TRINITY_DN1198_c0_g1_i1.p1 TRINITY_DN1198_c0_g1~~TRINITY_DN1198_c0_g1_i1.p1  ORF type:complete len:424 (-),score=31.25 TRINITY_DN1198_c0_g1_i1:888-2159(-)
MSQPLVEEAPPMRSNITTEASLGTRISVWWNSLPIVTAAVFALCVVVYVVGVLIGYDDFISVCMSPLLVIKKFEVYRPFTSVIFHGGLLHICFNMLAYVPMGSALERLLGSVRSAHLLLLIALTNAIIHILVAYVLSYLPFQAVNGLMRECSIGLSGVLFSLIVIETRVSGTHSRSIFGLFSVPAKWYPWALMLLFQLLMPNVSLLGHLSGIVSGTLYSQGVFNVFLPSNAVCSSIESSRVLAPLVRQSGFIVGGTSLAALSSSLSDPTGMSDAPSRIWRGLQGWLPALPMQNVVGSSAPANAATSGPPSDPRFPGTGRTIGSPGASGGGNRLVKDGSRTGDASERLLGADKLAKGAGDSTKPPSERWQPGGRSTTAPVTQPTGEWASEVSALVSMGFDGAAAKSALIAANGNVEMAIEYLSG